MTDEQDKLTGRAMRRAADIEAAEFDAQQKVGEIHRLRNPEGIMVFSMTGPAARALGLSPGLWMTRLELTRQMYDFVRAIPEPRPVAPGCEKYIGTMKGCA